MDTNNKSGTDIKIAYENICAITALLKIMGDAIGGKRDLSDKRIRVVAKTAVGLASVVKDTCHLEADDIVKYGSVYCAMVAHAENMEI